MEFSVIILLSLTSLVYGYDFRRRCIVYMKKCVDHCPRDMHPYHTRCDGHTLSQRTCLEQEIYNMGFTCGWSRCDCNGDLVLNEEDGACIDVHDCQWPKSRRSKNRIEKAKQPFRMSRKFKPHDFDDPIDMAKRHDD